MESGAPRLMKGSRAPSGRISRDHLCTQGVAALGWVLAPLQGASPVRIMNSKLRLLIHCCYMAVQNDEV